MERVSLARDSLDAAAVNRRAPLPDGAPAKASNETEPPSDVDGTQPCRLSGVTVICPAAVIDPAAANTAKIIKLISFVRLDL